MVKTRYLILTAIIAFALMGCKSNSPDDADTTAPTVGTEISFSVTSASSTTVSWGAAADDTTDPAHLQYLLVIATSAESIDSIAKAQAITGIGIVMDWTANICEKTVTGLSAGTTYYFAALVRDAAGNISLYAPKSVTTPSSLDAIAPIAGTEISFSGISASSTTVIWGAATDNVTAKANLQYKLVKAAAAASIDTIAKVSAITSGSDLVMDWTAAATNTTVTGFTANTEYWFAVLVRDAAGNMSLYAPKSVTTTAFADATAPTAGTDISFSGTSSTSTTVSWGAASDNVTAQANLQYKLVKAAAVASIDTVAKVSAITSGSDLVMDWTAAATGTTATGFTASTVYWFAVLVRDAAGNMSLYEPKSVTTSSFADTTAPTAGTNISFSGTSSTSTTVSWGAASDNVTAQANLQYKLVKAAAPASIDTSAKADAISGEDLVMDWTTNDLSQAATGLSGGTTYWFAVLVKDAAGNICLYIPQTVTTVSDTTAPSVGTTISFSGVSSSALTVSWGTATDNVTAQSSLRYKLVYSSSAAFVDTIAEANAATIENGGTVMDWTTNALSRAATGLSANTIYDFAVLVQDATGNISLYLPQEVTTSAVADTTAPSAGTAISFSGTSSSSTAVSWGAASDNVTAQANLQYKLVRAAASSSIDTVAEVFAITSGNGLVMDWTAAATGATASGLTASTVYYFAAIVRDGAGNMTLYSPQSLTTGAVADTTAPTAGTAIVYSGTGSVSTTVGWGAATDNVTAQASLQYKLVRASASSSIDTVAEVLAITSGTGLVMDWTTAATDATATGLTAGTTYYFATLVKDDAGNMTLYSPQSVTTATITNLVYNLNSTPGSEWTKKGDWQWGTVTNVGPVGSICYGTVLNGDYTSNSTTYNTTDFTLDYVQLGPLNLSGYTAAAGFRMTFQGWFEVESGVDICGLLYSTNGTTFTVVPASAVTGYPYLTDNTAPSMTEGWSPDGVNPGQQYQWRSVTVDLGSLGLNGKTAVYFRWALSSDDSTVNAGYYIDNVDIGY